MEPRLKSEAFNDRFFGWMDRTWISRLIEPLAFPLMLLLQSTRYLGPMPAWLLWSLTLGVLAWFWSGIANAGRFHRPRRDRSRPILEQLDEVQAEVSSEQWNQTYPPPPTVEQAIRLLVLPPSKVLDAAATILLIGTALIAIANLVSERDLSAAEYLARFGIEGVGFSRWHVALVACTLMFLASLRLWAVARCSEFDRFRPGSISAS